MSSTDMLEIPKGWLESALAYCIPAGATSNHAANLVDEEGALKVRHGLTNG